MKVSILKTFCSLRNVDSGWLIYSSFQMEANADVFCFKETITLNLREACKKMSLFNNALILVI